MLKPEIQASLFAIRFLGVGNSHALELGTSSCVLEQNHEPLLLIDCGFSTLAAYTRIYSNSLPLAIFITHTHLDHIGGLENLFYQSYFKENYIGKIKLFVPVKLVEILHKRMADYSGILAEGGVNFWDNFQLIPVSDHFGRTRQCLCSQKGINSTSIKPLPYQRALQINPDYDEAWVGMGDVYYKQGQFPLSFDAYLNACTRDSPARNQRITELLDKNNYRTVDGKNVLTQESLNLLYDKQYLEKLREKVTDCRSRYRNVAPTLVPDSLLNTFVVFRNIHFTLRKKGVKSIQVSGHTDIQPFKGVSRGENNIRQLKLSQQRAASVADALAKRGVPINRMTTKGYGYNKPAQGYTKAAWDKNRRVEIEVE